MACQGEGTRIACCPATRVSGARLVAMLANGGWPQLETGIERIYIVLNWTLTLPTLGGGLSVEVRSTMLVRNYAVLGVSPLDGAPEGVRSLHTVTILNSSGAVYPVDPFGLRVFTPAAIDGQGYPSPINGTETGWTSTTMWTGGLARILGPENPLFTVTNLTLTPSTTFSATNRIWNLNFNAPTPQTGTLHMQLTAPLDRWGRILSEANLMLNASPALASIPSGPLSESSVWQRGINHVFRWRNDGQVITSSSGRSLPPGELPAVGFFDDAIGNPFGGGLGQLTPRFFLAGARLNSFRSNHIALVDGAGVGEDTAQVARCRLERFGPLSVYTHNSYGNLRPPSSVTCAHFANPADPTLLTNSGQIAYSIRYPSAGC